MEAANVSCERENKALQEEIYPNILKYKALEMCAQIPLSKTKRSQHAHLGTRMCMPY